MGGCILASRVEEKKRGHFRTPKFTKYLLGYLFVESAAGVAASAGSEPASVGFPFDCLMADVCADDRCGDRRGFSPNSVNFSAFTP